MVACEFPISAPGLLHLSTLLIGTVCVSLGFMTHLHAPWVSKQEYKLCDTANTTWNQMTDAHCPDISLETAFLVLVVICLTSSFLWYSCQVCCFGTSKSAAVLYVLYLGLAAVFLIIAGVLYIKSAVMISKLPSLQYGTVVQNMGKVLVATISIDKTDGMNMTLTPQSDEQTYYQEKMVTGVLTIINGVLHIMCAWLSVLDRHA